MVLLHIYKFILLPIIHILYELRFLPTKVLLLIYEQKHGVVHRPTNLNSGPQSSAREHEKQIETQTIWIHAASGEIEYAKPLIQKLYQLYPETPIILTYTSPSGKNLIKSIPNVFAWMPLPWDSDEQVKKFIQKWNPKIVLFSRTDVWPNVAYHLKKQNIPAFLFSATLASNSSRIKGIGKYFSKITFNNLTEIFCVSDSDRINFESLKLKTPIKVLGDTRYDQVLERIKTPVKLININFPRNNIIIFASTWPDDESEIIPNIPELIELGYKIIIAPHEVHPQHINLISTNLLKFGLTSIYYSKTESWLDPKQILILDKYGVLAHLYTIANIAFVGGSFKAQVHSVMEPLAAGLPVIVGPYYENNREAVEFMQLDYVKSIHSGEQLVNMIKEFSSKMNQANEIKQIVTQKSGATNKICAYLGSLK